MAHLIGCLEIDGIEVHDTLMGEGILCPSTYGVTIIMDGEGRMSLNGTPISMTPCAFLLVRDGDICYFEGGSNLKCFTILFTEKGIYGDPSRLPSVYENVRHLTPDRYSDGIRNLYQRVTSNATLTGDEGVTMWRIWLTELLLHVNMVEKNQTGPCVMREVAAYLEENAHEEVSLDVLSHGVGISKFHLLRRFRDEVGMTPHTYLAYVRITRAKKLLEKGVAAAEVARQTGFRDYSTFFRTFRKLEGSFPTSGKGKEAGV
jgi:AraC-like DNA-binding protein